MRGPLYRTWYNIGRYDGTPKLNKSRKAHNNNNDNKTNNTKTSLSVKVHESLRTDNYGEPWGEGDVIGFLVRLKSPSPDEMM